jgi:ParB family chromosome partitioning protein
MSLGRGLSSLIPSWQIKSSSSSETKEQSLEREGDKVFYVSPDLIDPNPYQPRDTFPHGSMEELINSIKRYGILEPLLVTKKEDGRYELISGERRLRAAKFLSLPTVPVIVKRAEDLEKLELSLIENLQREDLNPIEEAEGYRKLVDEFNLTQEEVAKRVGKSREVVANSLRLLSLPGEIQAAIASGKLTPTHGRLLLQITDPKEQKALFNQMLKEHWTIKEAEIKAGKQLKRRLRRNIFKDSKILSYEDLLREKMGTKVMIERGKKQGKIIIEFYSDEELDYLVNLLTKS